MAGSTPTAVDLVRLSEQMERDRDLGWSELQARDYEIGRSCRGGGEQQQLLCWLERVEQQAGMEPRKSRALFSESALGLFAVVLSFIFGFLAMVGFLFAHGQGVVNVLWFLAIFVALQVLLWLFSALTLALVLLGGTPATINLNPARWMLAKSIPGRKHWHEFQDVVQLVFLRYGQGMGIGFITGCIVAFVLVLALNDFTFIWSSTFNISDEVMLGAAEAIAWPWAQWLPAATVDAEIVSQSRYYPTGGKFSPEQVRSMHSWWPLLLAAMIAYVLLPRLLLWALARVLYQRRITHSFLRYPGVELVVRRMNRPLVRTQGRADPSAPPDARIEMPREGVLVVNWSGAISPRELGLFDELGGLDSGCMVDAGLSFEEDEAAAARAAQSDITLVLLVVKSWEPPMADLADFVAGLVGHSACVVFLRPLDGEDIPADRLEDWRRFAGEVPGSVQVKALNRTPPEAGVGAADDPA